MSVPAHTLPPHTDGDDVHVRMRARGDAVVRPIRPDLNDRTAYTHAISRSPHDDQATDGSKIRNFVSQHAGEAAAELGGSWLATGTMRPLIDTVRSILPAKGEARGPHWIGVVVVRTFKLAAQTVAYLLYAAVDTDIRAAVALTLTVLAFTAALALTLVAGH